MNNNAVGLMTKQPEPGLVKKRLAANIGEKAACEIYRALLENVLYRSQPDTDSTYSFGAFVQPVTQKERFREQFEIDNSLDFCMGQPEGDLGKKMLYAFEKLFDFPDTKKVILIGADIPALGRKQIEAGFNILEKYDVVFGPTDDGGYYLIGMKKVHLELFKNIDWGTPHVLSRSTQLAKQCGLSYSLTELLSDLDTVADLYKFPDFKNKVKSFKR